MVGRSRRHDILGPLQCVVPVGLVATEHDRICQRGPIARHRGPAAGGDRVQFGWLLNEKMLTLPLPCIGRRNLAIAFVTFCSSSAGNCAPAPIEREASTTIRTSCLHTASGGGHLPDFAGLRVDGGGHRAGAWLAVLLSVTGPAAVASEPWRSCCRSRSASRLTRGCIKNEHGQHRAARDDTGASIGARQRVGAVPQTPACSSSWRRNRRRTRSA